jgi:hypothetical protein
MGGSLIIYHPQLKDVEGMTLGDELKVLIFRLKPHIAESLVIWMQTMHI